MTKHLRQRLDDAVSSASKADPALAAYMLAQFGTLPFETAASLAAKVEVSKPTVGRFCRAIGYAGFKDLKKNLRNDMGDRPWLIDDRQHDLRSRTRAGEDQLTCGLELEMAALVAVYRAACTPEWDVEARMNTVARLYGVFTSHVDNSLSPRTDPAQTKTDPKA